MSVLSPADRARRTSMRKRGIHSRHRGSYRRDLHRALRNHRRAWIGDSCRVEGQSGDAADLEGPSLTLSPDLLKKWIKLHGTFRRKKDIRNKVAHFDMGLTKVNKRPVPYLAGKPYDATASIKYPDGNAPRMNRRQLQRFRNDFHSFAQELLRFAARIPAPAKSRETSSR
jgi:hypothetical protein